MRSTLITVLLLLSLCSLFCSARLNCTRTWRHQLHGVRAASGACVWEAAAHIQQPRGMIAAPNGDLLVILQDSGSVVALWDANNDGRFSSRERAVLAVERGLNHGIEVKGGYLYASSCSTVYRWRYVTGAREPLGAAQIVVRNIPCGLHVTRTLRFAPGEGNLQLLVQGGSMTDVDPDASNASIRLFDVAQFDAGAASFDWDDGSVFASGVRNTVGVRFDHLGRCWGVDNGVGPLLSRDDLGGDLNLDHPAEELNLFAEPGRFYGYPYCWSQGLEPFPNRAVRTPPGTQYAQPEFLATHTDAVCQNRSRVVPPVAVFQAHMAPLDIMFWPEQTSGFPSAWANDAFVSFHGYRRTAGAGGRTVVRVVFDDGTHMPSGQIETLLNFEPAPSNSYRLPRAAGLAVAPCPYRHCLFVSWDKSNQIIGIGFE
jgi:glucose/arabinose dehydrogenase